MMKNVIGVSMCLEKMSSTECRCGREACDDEIYYQVRGKFGKSKDEDQDDMGPSPWDSFGALVKTKVPARLHRRAHASTS